MELPELISLTTFATVAAFTPGPNNLLLAASSANFGWRKTLPHMLGVIAGFTLLVTIAALGLGWLLTALPGLQVILRVLGLVFILFIAYSLAESHSLDRRTLARPMRFIEAVLFQWINPKGVVVIISAISAYTDTSTIIISEVLILVALFFCVTLGSVLLWAFSGALIARQLDTERKLMLFNRGAAALLVVSVAPVLLDFL
ncbi:MAG: LysE family translocator [Pseudomonadales bacterium]